MKILVIATWYPHQQNPAEAPFNADHVEAIRSRGHQVRVIHVRLGAQPSRDNSESEDWNGTPVLRVAANPKYPRTLVRALRIIRQQLRWADVIHTMAFSAILPTMLPWSVAKITGKNVAWVHTEHWNGVVNPASVSPNWARFAGMRHILRLPHVVGGVTKQLAQEMSHFSRGGATRVIPCVVRAEGMVTDAVFGHDLRLVSVGGLIPRKRPLRTIETIAWLREQGTSAELVWVGDGPQRAECEEAIAKFGLQDQVTLVGAVAPDQVSQYIASADLFFLPTEQENFFTSAAEALAMGRAVVATRVGGFSDYADQSNSRLVEDVSAESLGSAILDAREAFQEVDAATIAAPIRKRFSLESIGLLIDDAYAAAITRS